MCPDRNGWLCLVVGLVLVTSSEAFFLKWGSDSRQSPVQKAWAPQMSSNRYQQYIYQPYEPRKVYQVPAPHPQYAQPEMQMQQSMGPIPISMPAGASLTPVSLQHVQLVPCMCPVAPEEAEKLQEQVGPGPYLPQTYPQSTYVPQQVAVPSENKITPPAN